MTLESAEAADAARDLWLRAERDPQRPKGFTEVAEQLCVHLRIGLGRWVGTDGYRALLERALSQTRKDHPVLDSLSCHGGEGSLARGSLRAQDAGEVAAGMIALVTALIDLLGRIIGQAMAINLVEQIGTRSPRAAVNIKRKTGRDG